MMLFYWLSAGLLFVGALLLLDIRPFANLPTFRQLLGKVRNTAQRLLPKRSLTLREKTDRILGRQKENIFQRTLGEAMVTLEKTGEQSKGKRMERSCYLFSAAGVCIGLLFRNYFLAPALGIGLYFIPLWLIKLSYNTYIAHVNEELEIALSQVTSGYESSNNLLSAVKDNLQYIKSPVYEAFERFVTTVESVDPNFDRALTVLQGSFDSFIFKEWCSALKQCQRDSSLKSTLRPHVNKFSRQKHMQEKQRTGQMLAFKEFLIMCILTVAVPVGLVVFVPDWFRGLPSHPAGKLVISITVIAMIAGLNKAVDIAAPYQFKR